jgi:hypothetical protein
MGWSAGRMSTTDPTFAVTRGFIRQIVTEAIELDRFRSPQRASAGARSSRAPSVHLARIAY